MKKVQLVSNKIKHDYTLHKFLKPEFVYIPLIVQNNANVVCEVKVDDYVHKGQVVGSFSEYFSLKIHSSVSGTVKEIKKMRLYNNELVKCIVIENDFKEDTKYNEKNIKQISDYTKEEFIDNIQNSGIIGMGGAGFPTYFKYKSDNINTLIVNAVECEPFVSSDHTLILNNCEEILEAIDSIMEINNISKCYIAIKDIYSDLKNEFDKYIGTYPNIELFFTKNYYPAGWERNLIKDIMHLEYNNLPIEKGIVVNNVSTIYAIYESLKYNKPNIERIITVSGNLVKNTNILIKIGTTIKQVADFIGIKETKKLKVIVGGPMMGKTVFSLDTVITKNVNSIILSDEEFGIKEENCLKCGKCSDVCPSKLCPVLIMENIENKEELTILQPNKCIECGLCSYICPSKILLRGKVIEAKQVLRGDKK